MCCVSAFRDCVTPMVEVETNWYMIGVSVSASHK